MHSDPAERPVKIALEVCVDSVESAIIAEKNGANRLELCSNLPIGGGTTPSIGMIRTVVDVVHIPVMVLIRHRVGSFVYTPEEISVMQEDIRAINAISRTAQTTVGVVIGALTTEGRVDIPAILELAKFADSMPITFHRAFDMTQDAEEALNDLAQLGRISRILTSGQASSCLKGLEVLRRLMESAEKSDHVLIMPGSGIKSSNVNEVLDALYPMGKGHSLRTRERVGIPLAELHLSAGHFVHSSTPSFRRDGLGFGIGGTITTGDRDEWEKREWGKWTVNAEELQEVRRIVDQWCREAKRDP